MTDVDQVLVANFLEALKQVQRYVVLGLGTSVSALALVLKPRAATGQATVTVPGTFVAIDPQAAHAVLLCVCILMGAMAYYSAETANGIATRLRSSPDLLRAASAFPSIATSAYPGVRYVAAFLPLVLSLAALLIPAFRDKPVDWSALMGWFIFLGAAYGALALELRRPIGSS